MKKKILGFTLLELMVVVAIVGILSLIAFPSYTDTVRKARRSDAYDALLECAAAQTRFFTSRPAATYFSGTRAKNDNLCRTVGNKLVSGEGHYELTISNNNCTSNNLFYCFSITANATGGQMDDTDCQSFTIDHTGRQTASPDTQGKCWRS